MLGLVLLYFAGKAFYDLAGKYNKHQWGFAILGVVSYYGGLFFGGVLIGIVMELSSPGYIDEGNETFFGILAIPLGIFTCWLTYVLLKRAWSKPREIDRQTLDGDLIASQSTERYNKEER
jgi:hypothetical protein